ncbi:TIR domain-containing protein [Saccharopolyspora kobensis]|uniref:TIR domain-containing protein n=1 Tax=Saccharopolyspora kobensis TaxID=146035 RepID=A0A1H6CA67_9PSEU|nr:TIR domain-containing protein [Saccharopolyspora kobensis]SEG69525.1 TIR domain-containing protein [Saccharopolyspora kobensis]SFC32839.1 TIR domain-containing protein [Saccharopolyspora kobensis]
MRREQGYDAFISYSHALSAKLAPAVQDELQRFAKPWYRGRALRVFRDETNLSADPGLWATIERGLRDSRWFVLLASPEAAGSEWVAKEVEFWLRERSPETLLIVLVDGSLVWDGDDFDWSRTTALPAVLRGAFEQEPRWVDLTWLDAEEQVDRANPRFRESIAEIAAPLRGLSKDELVGEHIRTHRRNLRTAWGAVSALVLLLVLSLIAGSVAVYQGGLAQERASIAMARLLTSESSNTQSTQLDLSQLLAVEAFKAIPSTESSAAMLRAVTATPRLAGYLQPGSAVTTLLSQDESLIAGTADGRVLRWPIAEAVRTKPSEWASGLRESSGVAASRDGSVVAATDGTAVRIGGAQEPVQVVPGRKVSRIALSPDGRWLVVSTTGENAGIASPSELVVYEAATGAEAGRAVDVVSDAAALVFPDPSSVQVGAYDGVRVGLSLPDLRVLSTAGPVAPANNYTPAYSPNADTYGYLWENRLNTIAAGEPPARTGPTVGGATSELVLPIASSAEAVAIAPGGKRFAIVLSGVVQVGGTEELGSARTPLLTELRGTDRVGSLVFSVDGRFLAAAVGNSIVVWDLAQPSLIADRTGALLGDRTMFPGKPGLAVSPTGEQLLVTPELSDDTAVRVRLRGNAVDDLDFGYESGRAAWAPDGTGILMVQDSGAARLYDGGLTRLLSDWEAPPAGEMTGTPMPGMTARVVEGGRAVFADRTGRIVVRALPDGEVLQDLGLDGWPGWTADDVHSAQTAVDARGRHVAMSDADQVLVVDLRTGISAALQGDVGARGVEFTPDGRLLVQRETGLIELWDVENRHLERTLDGADIAQDTLAVSPDGRFLAGLRADGGVVLVDLPSGKRLGVVPLPRPERSLRGETGQISTVEFSADSRELLSASTGGELLRWPLDPAEWQRHACESAGRDITAEEWQRVVGLTPPDDLRCTR